MAILLLFKAILYRIDAGAAPDFRGQTTSEVRRQMSDARSKKIFTTCLRRPALRPAAHSLPPSRSLLQRAEEGRATGRTTSGGGSEAPASRRQVVGKTGPWPNARTAKRSSTSAPGDHLGQFLR